MLVSRYPVACEVQMHFRASALRRLDTRQPETVFKKLDTKQSEILTSFLEIARLIPLRTQDTCQYCLGLKVEVIVELGHGVKSQCFRNLENIQVLTH